MREIYEINRELLQCQEKLSRLTSKPTGENFEYRNGDVYSVPRGETVGSTSEINTVRKRIEELRNELKEREKWDAKAPERQEEAQRRQKEMDERQKQERLKAKEERKKDEERRLQTFQDIKKKYKVAGKKHKWERFINKIQGKSPNWKKIKEYSQEELEFLRDIQRGETKIQKNRKANTKEARQKNWDDFVRKANSKYEIKKGIEYEEEYHIGM